MSIFYKGKQIAGNEVTLSEVKTQSKEEVKNLQKEGANQLAIVSKKVEEAVGVAIGTYLDIASNSTYTPSGYLLRDGAEYNGKQFQNLWDNWLFSIPTYTADSNVTIPMEYGHYDGSLYWNTSYQARMPISVPHDENGFMYGDVDIVIKTENYKTTSPRADYMFEFYYVDNGSMAGEYAYFYSLYSIVDKLTYVSISSNVTGVASANIASLESDSEYTIKITNSTEAQRYNIYLIDKNGISKTLYEGAYYNMRNLVIRPSGFGFFVIDRCKYVDEQGKDVYFATINNNSLIKTLNYDEYNYQVEKYGYCDKFAIKPNKISTQKHTWTGSYYSNTTKLAENFPLGINLTFTYNGTNWNCTDGNVYTSSEMQSLTGYGPSSSSTVITGDTLEVSYNPAGTFKAPLANPNNRVLIEKKEPTGSDPTWYNLYNDGWCEQGGVTTPSASTANKEVVLGVEYRDISYQVLIGNQYTASATAVSCVVTSTKTTTGFTIADAKNAAYYTYWRTQGYTDKVVEGSTRPYVVVANGELNQSMMDWSAWASSLQGKINTDHSNDTKPYIVEVSNKSILPSWYRVWSDGWIEQGGISSAVADKAVLTVSFLKSFVNTNYDLQVTSIWQGTNDDTTWMQAYQIRQDSLKVNSFDVYSRSTTQKVFRWYVCGY